MWTCFDTIILLVPDTERVRTWSWLMMIFHIKVHNRMRSACFFIFLFPIQNVLERGVGSKFSKAKEIEQKVLASVSERAGTYPGTYWDVDLNPQVPPGVFKGWLLVEHPMMTAVSIKIYQ